MRLPIGPMSASRHGVNSPHLEIIPSPDHLSHLSLYRLLFALTGQTLLTYTTIVFLILFHITFDIVPTVLQPAPQNLPLPEQTKRRFQTAFANVTSTLKFH